jgi:putative flippase GtrA
MQTMQPEPVPPTRSDEPGGTDPVGRALEALLDRLPVPASWRRTVSTMSRSMCVSIGTSALSATVLAVLAVGFGVAAGTANVIATLCGIGPSYAYNRRWAWKRTGRGNLWREVVPFWILCLCGLVLSTAAVDVVSSWGAAWPDAVRAVALPAANVAAFGVLWLAQFAFLDRVLFARPEALGG